jgi:hypothetical protein
MPRSSRHGLTPAGELPGTLKRSPAEAQETFTGRWPGPCRPTGTETRRFAPRTPSSSGRSRNAATTGSRNRHLSPGRAPLAELMAQPGDGRGCGSPAHSRSVVAGQRSALRRFCPRAARRETAVTAESAWCSALAVRVDGSRRSAASASRWASARVSGRAMASSSHIRRRLEKNAHMLRVPSSFLPCAPALPALSRANHVLAEVRRLPGTGQGSSGRS